MKEPKYLAIAVFVLLLGGAGARLLYQHAATIDVESRAMIAEGKIASADAEKKRLQQKMTALQTRLEKMEADAAQQSAVVATDRKAEKRDANAAAKRAARATGLVSAESRAEPAAAWIASASDPAVVRRLNAQARLQTLRHYGALLDQLGLAAEQREQLTRLLTDKRQVPLDVAAASFQGGTDPREDPAGFRDMVAATRQDLEKQIHALLGDTSYESYQQYDHIAGQSQVITRLGQLLTEIQQPLNPAQTTQLQASMQTNDTGRITAKVVTDAKGFLSPAQLQALRDLRAIQQANSQKRNVPVPVLPTAPGGN